MGFIKVQRGTPIGVWQSKLFYKYHLYSLCRSMSARAQGAGRNDGWRDLA